MLEGEADLEPGLGRGREEGRAVVVRSQLDVVAADVEDREIVRAEQPEDVAGLESWRVGWPGRPGHGGRTDAFEPRQQV